MSERVQPSDYFIPWVTCKSS